MATDPFSGLGPGCSLSGWMMKHMKLLPRPLLPREKLRNRGTSDGDHDHDVTMVIYKVWTHLVYQILPHLNNAEKTARPLLDLPPKTPWEYDIDPPRRGLLQGSLPCLVCFFHTRLRIAPPLLGVPNARALARGSIDLGAPEGERVSWEERWVPNLKVPNL